MSTIVITGAGRGIGMATALVLARAGHSVIATMRDPAGSPELSRLSTSEGLQLRVEQMDVTSDASVEACLTEVQSRGPVDVLVNNAGVLHLGAVEESALNDFRACMETNYFGSLRCIKAVARQMRERGRGTIINISSVAGRISIAPMAPYAASKFALEAVSETLAQEMKPLGVRVAIVEPGVIDTRMAREVESLPRSAVYPTTKRIAALFAVLLRNGAATPEVVAGKIREIVESDGWQLRHEASPDAGPFLGWRRSMSDEQWTDWGALDDHDWAAAIKRDFGIDVNL
jgi:NAD(P)-dependent dehydrogenase (short-subunit alcohol dehydrogenase family)